MKRTLILLYGVVCYAVFFATFLYAIGFIGNLWVPKGMDSAPTAPFAIALLIDLGLLARFAVQHSVMARPAFKRAWTRLIPESAERSTYTLLSSLALILLFWQWSPLGGTVWEVRDPTARAALYAIYAFGWALLLYTTFLLNHFDLFGLLAQPARLGRLSGALLGILDASLGLLLSGLRLTDLGLQGVIVRELRALPRQPLRHNPVHVLL